MPVGDLQVVPGPGEVVKGRVRNWQGNTAGQLHILLHLLVILSGVGSTDIDSPALLLDEDRPECVPALNISLTAC
jgi:hypothetical protein